MFEEMIVTANVDQIVEGTPSLLDGGGNAASPWREGTGNRCRSITTVAVVPFQRGYDLTTAGSNLIGLL